MSVVEKEIGSMDDSGVDVNKEWEFNDVSITTINNEISCYNFSIPMSSLSQLYTENTIQYNYELQRGCKLNKKNQLVPISSAGKIREIFESIKNKSFFGNVITLCVLREEGEENPIYWDESNNTITGNSGIFLLDGHHRCMAFKKVCDMWNKYKDKQGFNLVNPELWNIPVHLRVLTTNQAKKLFSEYCKGLKVSKVRQEFLDVNTLKNDIVSQLMEKSELRGKIETYATNIKSSGTNNNIVTFSLLSTEIQRLFAPKTSNEVKNIAEFLIKFFNALVEEFSYSMGCMSIAERKQARLSDISIELMTFYGYMSMARVLYEKDQKGENIEENIRELNKPIQIKDWNGRFLSRENPLWNHIKKADGGIINNSSMQGYMRKVFTLFASDKDRFYELANMI